MTASSEGLNAPVDSRFGRAPFMVFIDSETGEAESRPNLAATAGHGAGTQAAQAVSRGGAEVLLTANCGPKAFELLRAAEVEVFSIVGGTVSEAYEAWKNDSLTRLENANAASGWSG
ncbi:MAG: NifB/NifX family molybdenum-iron cluster-binding protein [Thermoanaerobaculales bacterium]|nr:NifB/NifX family molybdenum-iron cluster-binding protein [Thermoanaerobaculales bacterium]